MEFRYSLFGKKKEHALAKSVVVGLGVVKRSKADKNENHVDPILFDICGFPFTVFPERVADHIEAVRKEPLGREDVQLPGMNAKKPIRVASIRARLKDDKDEQRKSPTIHARAYFSDAAFYALDAPACIGVLGLIDLANANAKLRYEPKWPRNKLVVTFPDPLPEAVEARGRLIR